MHGNSIALKVLHENRRTGKILNVPISCGLGIALKRLSPAIKCSSLSFEDCITHKILHESISCGLGFA